MCVSDKADLAVNSAENIGSRVLCVTGPQVQQYSSYQGGRTGQGKEVEAEKLGSGSFLQVVACKSGGRSLLPVEAGKIEVYIIRELFLFIQLFLDNYY